MALLSSIGSLSLVLAAALAAARTPPSDVIGPLREGDNGFFCTTRGESKRLFHRGGFYFCGTDARLPQRVTYAVIGDAPAGLAAALKRFADVLAERAGIAIAPGRRPDVLFVAAPLTPPSPGHDAHLRAVAALLARSGVSLPPDLEPARHIDLDLTPVFSGATTSTERSPGRPLFTSTSFYPGPDADLAAIVKDTFTTYLAIAAPLLRPEETAPNGVSHAPRLRPWLVP